MGKPLDMSKFLKTIDKSKSIGSGFHDPTIWVDTGHYLLNYFISGKFYRGIPLSKFTMFAGESGCLPLTAKLTASIDGADNQELTVGEVKEYFYDDHSVKVTSPNGMVAICDWYVKGHKTIVELKTDFHTTRCATDHMIQLSNRMWKPAGSIKVGDHVKTALGEEEIKHTTIQVESVECHDFTIDHEDHTYYSDGFCSHNSGKSFICSGSLVRNAQKMGIMPVIVDTENAIDEEWLKDLGVDTDPKKLMKFNLAKVNDVATVISEFMAWYKTTYDGVPKEDQQPFLFIIDSLGMTITDTEEKQFVGGEMKGDMGIKAKQLNSLVRNCVHMISEYNIGVVATNHVYASQDMFAPDDKVSGGKLLEYGASILVAMKKGKSKDGAAVTGIKSKCQVRKSRYGRPFISADVIIDFKNGVDPYSGLIEFFVEHGVLTQGGAYVTYVNKNGEEFKDYKSKFKDEWLKQAMDEFDYEKHALRSKVMVDEVVEELMAEQDVESDDSDFE